MVREMYLKRADALRAAVRAAVAIDGWWDAGAVVDSGMTFDRNEMTGPWSGECAAFKVTNDEGELVGLYGYWED